MYLAKVLADSVSPDGVRLTTLEVEYPHAVHKDIMTHRMLSRNFQSFRAFPPEKVIENILREPFMPDAFAHRLPGMEQGDPLRDIEQQDYARDVWMGHVENSVKVARELMRLDIAKQQVNFVLQDLTWIRGIISATDWDNFFALRAFAPEGAKPRPEVEKIAQMMYDAIDFSTPEELKPGEWHLPLVSKTERWDPSDPSLDVFTGNDQGSWNFWKRVATGRCARTSYLTHHGTRELKKDIQLHDGLLGNFHMSPFEHVATPANLFYRDEIPYIGNFRGWRQYRKEVPNEHNMMEVYEGEQHPYWRDVQAA